MFYRKMHKPGSLGLGSLPVVGALSASLAVVLFLALRLPVAPLVVPLAVASS